ncbi:MAG TPA: GIY-YIG nuclease family protein [Ferruginibacter sp.]|nr:GIY-YIG nuclease family protein [Ferruginibacter sp.]
MYTVYILYSFLADKFYIGYTGESVETRLKKHAANHKGFTSNQQDWKLVHTEIYELKKDAMKREKEIKNWKSRKMIEKLLSSTE